MHRRYHINLFWSDHDACWIADEPELTYCSVHGPTPDAALAEVETAITAWLAVQAEPGRPRRSRTSARHQCRAGCGVTDLESVRFVRYCQNPGGAQRPGLGGDVGDEHARAGTRLFPRATDIAPALRGRGRQAGRGRRGVFLLPRELSVPVRRGQGQRTDPAAAGLIPASCFREYIYAGRH